MIMVRLTINAAESNWAFHVDQHFQDKISKTKNKARIAFLSGCEREFYPSRPGHSKFALVHAPDDPNLPPGKIYDPLQNSLYLKGISKVGYGIGGLSAPRFPKDIKDRFPAPNAYQRDNRFDKQQSFPPGVWQNFGLMEKRKSDSNRGKGTPADMIGKKKANEEQESRKLMNLWIKCRQSEVAFGRSTHQERFGNPPKWNLVGPGHYAMRELKPPHVLAHTSFMRGPATINTPTKFHCAYGPKELCVECGKTLMEDTDYYRSRFRVRLPAHLIAEAEGRRKSETPAGMKFSIKHSKWTRVLLCRKCHCKALRGESRFWKQRRMVEWLFEKTRHCSFIHEHNGLPEYTEKASCHWTRRLARKEAVLTRFWPDKCERILKEKKPSKH